MTSKILTDTWIKQSPRWQRATDCIQNQNGGGLGLAVRAVGEILRRRKVYDVVVTSNVRTGVLFGIARRLLRLERPRHIVLELRLDEIRDSLLWRLKRSFQSFGFGATEVIFVSARAEIDSYADRLRLSKDRFRFLPFHTNVVEPRHEPPSGGYVFSGGRTGRDYSTLAEAVRGLDIPVVVVADSESVRDIQFPENVTVYTDIPYEKYRELLCGARIVVVPLFERVYSSGQVVVLEGMALGKPVVSNDTVGTVDYIVDGVNGILVANKRPELFREAIQRILDDPDLERRLGVAALDTINAKHTFEHYVEAVLNAADELGRLNRVQRRMKQ